MKELPPYKFTPVFEVILDSIRNRNEIKKAFDEMVDHFVENQDEFYDTLMQVKEAIESNPELTPGQIKALEDIERVFEEGMPADVYFTFAEELLLDDFTKIYRQIRDKNPVDAIRENKTVSITFYSLISGPDETESVIHNKLGVKKMTLRAQDFVLQYQMLFN